MGSGAVKVGAWLPGPGSFWAPSAGYAGSPRDWPPQWGERAPTHLAMVSTPSFTLSRSLLNVWIFMMEAATGSVEKCWEE